MLLDYDALCKETDFKSKFEEKRIQFQMTNFKFGYFRSQTLALRPRRFEVEKVHGHLPIIQWKTKEKARLLRGGKDGL
jgi:hypothetical protein